MAENSPGWVDVNGGRSQSLPASWCATTATGIRATVSWHSYAECTWQLHADTSLIPVYQHISIRLQATFLSIASGATEDVLREKVLPETRHQGSQRRIVVRDELDKVRVGIVEHDVEMLNGMHALQTRPVLEPDDMVRLHFGAERPLHKVFDASLSLRREVVRAWYLFQRELGPYNEVHNLLVDAVGPVVVENLDVICGA